MKFTATRLRVMLGDTTKPMANLIDRLVSNAPGAFYVDSSCIDCDICRTNAPAFFRRDDELGFSIVHRQPVTPQEIAEAQEAVEGCPSNSIAGNGLEKAS
jgi:ferredoxin